MLKLGIFENGMSANNLDYVNRKCTSKGSLALSHELAYDVEV